MTPEDRRSLAAVFRTAQALLSDAQRWYTTATGDTAIPPAILALRNALVDDNLQRLVETIAREARAA